MVVMYMLVFVKIKMVFPQISGPARSASASSRILELAKFKATPEGFLPNRGVQWPVSRSAKRAIATPRNEELAKPKIR